MRLSRGSRRSVLIAAGMLLWPIGIAHAEQVELTTYYPAPFGVYDTLVAERLVDYNAGTYTVPPVVGTDWFLDPSTTSVSATLQGRVGIGTNAPLAGVKLHVTGTETVGLRYAKTGSADARIQLGDPTQMWGLAVGWGGAAAGDWSLLEEGIASRLIVKRGSGNVGIGTTTPGQKFEVIGTTRVSASPADLPGFGVYMLDSGALELRRAGVAGAHAYIDFSNDPLADFDARLILTGDNNLAVQGAALDIGSAPLPATNADLRLSAGRNVSANDYWVKAIDKWVSDIGDAFDGGDGDWQRGGSNMWNLNPGNVGIGTSSPTAKLHVVGTTRSQGNVTVDSGNSITLGGAPKTAWPAQANQVKYADCDRSGNTSCEFTTSDCDSGFLLASCSGYYFVAGTYDTPTSMGYWPEGQHCRGKFSMHEGRVKLHLYTLCIQK